MYSVAVTMRPHTTHYVEVFSGGTNVSRLTPCMAGGTPT